ncbi:hypothetical protein Tco_0273936 [Tanacetum coccineum]
MTSETVGLKVRMLNLSFDSEENDNDDDMTSLAVEIKGGVTSSERRCLCYGSWNIEVVPFPYKYLGLPIGSDMNCIDSWSHLVSNFNDKLSNWKANPLFIGGRLTLTKVVSGSVAIYHMSIFKLPETTIRTLERIRVSFFWHGGEDRKKMAWVKWDSVLASLDKGGLAGFNFKRCKTQGNWDKIVGSINHLHSTGMIPHGSFKLKVGDGSNVRFWKDTWLGDVPLEARYNRLFHLDTHLNCFVSDHFVNDSWQWSWCMQYLGGNKTNSLSSLLNDLHDFKLGSGPDFWQWNLDVYGQFTVSGARHHQSEFFLPYLSSSTRWGAIDWYQSTGHRELGRLPDAGSGNSPEFRLGDTERASRARLARHDDTIDRFCDQLEEMSLDRMEEIEHDVEALQARVGAEEEKANMLQLALEDAWAEITELMSLKFSRVGFEFCITKLRVSVSRNDIDSSGAGAEAAGAGAARPAGGVIRGNTAPDVRGCTYKNFLNCNPHTFSGTEGAGNSHVHSVGIDAAYLTPWTELKEMMTAEFCPRNELAVMCLTMVTLEYKKIERYIWGLPESIQGNVTSSKPATTHDDIRMAYNLIDQVVRAKAVRGKKLTRIMLLPPNCQKTCHQSKDCRSKAPATGSNTHTSPADGTN